MKISNFSDNELIAAALLLEKNQSKGYKKAQGQIIHMLKDSKSDAPEARDRDFVMADDQLKETSKNFFGEV